MRREENLVQMLISGIINSSHIADYDVIYLDERSGSYFVISSSFNRCFSASRCCLDDRLLAEISSTDFLANQVPGK